MIFFVSFVYWEPEPALRVGKPIALASDIFFPLIYAYQLLGL
jgi:hypothetical protein